MEHPGSTDRRPVCPARSHREDASHRPDELRHRQQDQVEAGHGQTAERLAFGSQEPCLVDPLIQTPKKATSEKLNQRGTGNLADDRDQGKPAEGKRSATWPLGCQCIGDRAGNRHQRKRGVQEGLAVVSDTQLVPDREEKKAARRQRDIHRRAQPRNMSQPQHAQNTTEISSNCRPDRREGQPLCGVHHHRTDRERRRARARAAAISIKVFASCTSIGARRRRYRAQHPRPRRSGQADAAARRKIARACEDLPHG